MELARNARFYWDPSSISGWEGAVETLGLSRSATCGIGTGDGVVDETMQGPDSEMRCSAPMSLTQQTTMAAG
jgi:hypothetical protein